jgi:hypothetical protein
MIADPAAHTEALAFLALVNEETFMRAAALLPDLDANAIRLRADGLRAEIHRKNFTTFSTWIRSIRQEIDTRNSDNVIVFLKTISADIRYNLFLEQAEARKSQSDPWQRIDDALVGQLLSA